MTQATLNKDPRLLNALQWRCIGPPRGGRVVAVAGDPLNPAVFYFGACAGGVWKTDDAGTYWHNISDGYFKTAAVGAIVGYGTFNGENHGFLLQPIVPVVAAVPRTFIVQVSGDFNGDGYTDQAGLTEDSTIWLGVAGQPWRQLPGRLVALVAGDLDGDGQDDLAGRPGPVQTSRRGSSSQDASSPPLRGTSWGTDMPSWPGSRGILRSG